MNIALMQDVIAQMYIGAFRLAETLAQVDLLLTERATQVEAARRGIEVGGEYLIRKPGMSVQRIVVKRITGTADALKLQFAKRYSPSIYAIIVTPDTGVERI